MSMDNPMPEFASLSQAVMSLAVVLPRIAAAFLLLPFFTSEMLPPLVRNVFFVSVAFVVMPLVLQDPLPPTLSGTALVPILLKEIFIGVAIGFTFGIVFWALEAAGQVIDTKVGSGMGQLVDPLTGAQTTLIGAYLGRLGAYLFAAFGGLHVFVDLVLSSFRIWPVLDPLPDLRAVGALFFIERFDDLMRIMLLIAAPALVLLTLLEVGLGFVNRYAPQLNVFVLSLALKSWLAILILLLTVGTVASFITDWLADQRGLLQILPLGG
jgi:type III secretion protein T